MTTRKRRQQNAAAARRYRARKKDVFVEVYQFESLNTKPSGDSSTPEPKELLETPYKPPESQETPSGANLCPRCGTDPYGPLKDGVCPGCYWSVSKCKRSHCTRRAIETSHQGLCPECWRTSIERMLAEPPLPEPPELPRPAARDFQEERELEAQAGGCPLPPFNVFAADREYQATTTGEWNAHDRMRWAGEKSEREQLIEQIEANRRRKAGSQELERG